MHFTKPLYRCPHQDYSSKETAHNKLAVAEKFWRHTGRSTWQTEWKTAPLVIVQLYQTLEAFVAARSLYAKFDCPVARQKFSLLATAHDCENDLF